MRLINKMQKISNRLERGRRGCFHVEKKKSALSGQLFEEEAKQCIREVKCQKAAYNVKRMRQLHTSTASSHLHANNRRRCTKDR